MKKNESQNNAGEHLIWLDEKGGIIEPLFADYFLSMRPMKSFHERLFTVDGMIDDESTLKKEIYEIVRDYLKTGVAKKVDTLLQAVKLACAAEMPEIQTDRIHVANGTYFLDGHFVSDKEYCMNRLPVAYRPDAPAPTRWLQFVEELLYPEDVLTLQEYMGYCLLPVTKGQKMLLIIGKGGEGKSRIGLVLRSLLGNNMNNSYILKLETSKFARADLEYKLVMVDDDMVMKKLAETHIIKTIVTTEDKIIGFLKSEGYFEITPGKSCKSADLYTVYQRWCRDNLEDSVARSNFVHYLKENSKQIGIIYDAKCVENCRGFHNVDLNPFAPTSTPCPWNK